MFFEAERLPTVQKMILAENVEDRQKALDVLLPMQREDFRGLFETMSGNPVIIRLIDPPLHEFLPAHDELESELHDLEEDKAVPHDAEIKEVERVLGRVDDLHEENPMLGFRGASRYRAESFADCFKMECKALKRVREDMGLTNVQVMIPFVRTVDEARQVKELLAENGLRRGENDLKLIMMCEIPSNALLAEDFLEHFDGMSIGSNDMTQLTLGLDRDSAVIADLFDERNPAVLALLKMAIDACRKQGKYIGICGQGPSDHPDLAQWLLAQGIESISLNPDTVLETWLYLAGESV
jgi:pyruvate,water dikinase